MDNNSSYGVNFIEDYIRCYQYAYSFDLFLEEVLSYNYKFIEFVGGYSTQVSSNLPMTNYTEKPFVVDYELVPSLGLTLDTINYERFGVNPYAFLATSAFFQLYLNLKKFKVILGSRYEFNSLFEESISNPRIAVLYSVNKNNGFRVSAGKAYKPPAGNLMFQSIAFPVSTADNPDAIIYAVVPNTNLLPEYITSYEIGYRGAFFDRNISADVAVYYNTIENMIVPGYINASSIYPNVAVFGDKEELARTWVNTSIAETNYYGIDLALTINNIYNPANVKLSLFGTYTFGNETLPNGEEIDYLRGIPKYMFKINISANPYRKSYIKLENTLMSGWHRSFLPEKDFYVNSDYPHIPGYFISDLIIGYRMHTNLNVFLKFTNLTGANYGGIDGTSLDVDLRYNPQHGASFRFGLSFILN